MGKLTLILGGARSGKSTYAEKLAAQRSEQVLYIATAQALDAEMAERIKKHRAHRPQSWQTREIPINIAGALKDNPPQAPCILLDCLTMLVSNVIMTITDDDFEPDEVQAGEVVAAELDALLETIQNSEAEWILVSNEVGMGLVPPYPLGRVYRDLLGWVNQRVAAVATEVYFLVAGMALPLHEFALLRDSLRL